MEKKWYKKQETFAKLLVFLDFALVLFPGECMIIPKEAVILEWNLEEALQYYKNQGAPRDQTACLNLLKEIQQEQGGIPSWMITRAAEAWSIKESLLLALVRRIPSLRLQDSHILEVCSGPNCGKRTEIADFVEKTYGRKPKNFIYRFCGCMRQCGKGPNIRWDGKVYNAATPALVKQLVEGK